MKWSLEITLKAKKDLKSLDKTTQNRILNALNHLVGQQGRVDLKKLQGTDKWRLRVGIYRVILKIGENGKITVYALRVLHRKEAYRDL